LEVKLIVCHFDTIEVIEAELQAVLNTLTEHDFQDAFKNWQKRWERFILAEFNYFEGDGGQQPQRVSVQMAAPVPEIMGTTS
jgi:hypothetical protein